MIFKIYLRVNARPLIGLEQMIIQFVRTYKFEINQKVWRWTRGLLIVQKQFNVSSVQTYNSRKMSKLFHD